MAADYIVTELFEIRVLWEFAAGKSPACDWYSCV